MDSLIKEIDSTRIPAHVAIIMDGNGRWAQSRGLERSEGHITGVDAVHRVIECASNLGIKYLTLYAFSTENWNRPQAEVEMLWHLIVTVLEAETPNLIRNNVRLNVIGDIDRLPEHSRVRLEDSINTTSGCTGMQVNLALSYSSRWELTDAVRRIANAVKEGELALDDINEQVVADALTTASMPDPDILIRTGGDIRVSNFLLWQLAYAELYFTPVYWPDFGENHLYRAIIDYQSRERRFGMTSEQIKNS